MIDMIKDKYSITKLCKYLGCSKSGYYDWVKAGRPYFKAFDKVTNELVLKTYNKHPEQGIRPIRMNIKRKYGIILTNYTVYRYMLINNIQATSRRKTHGYPKLPHHDIPNLLRRNFNTDRPNKKWSIDISYIFAHNGLKYLCAIKDMYDKSIISYSISAFIDLNLVINTVNKAIKKVPYKYRKELILHSDQGWHFTNWQYRQLLIDNHITQSISAKGSSVDNVPIESFFSCLKSECIYRINKLDKNDIEYEISKFIKYYNTERLQEKLKELTPIEYRSLALNNLF